MDKTLEVQKKILTSADARKAFAADPRGFLTKEGLQIPEGVSLPKSLPLDDFEKRIAAVDKQLRAKGIDPAHLSAEAVQKAGLTNVNALQSMNQELSDSQLEQVAGGRATERATAAVVALLVVAVGVGVWSSV